MKLLDQLCEHVRISIDILLVHSGSIDFHSGREDSFVTELLIFAFQSLLFDRDFDFVLAIFFVAPVRHNLQCGHQILLIHHVCFLPRARRLVVVHQCFLKLVTS